MITYIYKIKEGGETMTRRILKVNIEGIINYITQEQAERLTEAGIDLLIMKDINMMSEKKINYYIKRGQENE